MSELRRRYWIYKKVVDSRWIRETDGELIGNSWNWFMVISRKGYWIVDWWKHSEFIVLTHFLSAKSLLIPYLFREFTFIQVFSPNHYKLTIGFAISLCIHYFIPEITMNVLLSAKSIWIHYLNFTLSVSRIHYEFTIFFAIKLWIHYPFREITENLLSFPRIYYKFTICFANSTYIHIFPPNHFEFTICFAFHYNFTIFSRIHKLFRVITMNSLWNNYEITMKSLEIHFFSWIHILFAISIWIHYLIPEITMNVLH